jgi:hypothetical protein
MAVMATTTRGTRRTRNTRTSKTEAQAPVEPVVEPTTTPEGGSEPNGEAEAPKAKAPTNNNLRWTFQDKDAYEDGKNQTAPSPFGGSYAILGETGNWSARYTDADGNETVLAEPGSSFGKAYNASVKHHRGLKEAAKAAAASTE